MRCPQRCFSSGGREGGTERREGGREERLTLPDARAGLLRGLKMCRRAELSFVGRGGRRGAAGWPDRVGRVRLLLCVEPGGEGWKEGGREGVGCETMVRRCWVTTWSRRLKASASERGRDGGENKEM